MREALAGAAVLALALALALGVAGCDRNIEPFDPGEQPEQPDLSRIFPAGGDRAPAGEAPPAPAAPAPAPAASADAQAIRGSVRLTEELADRVPAGAVLFVIARSVGIGPPLAVKRVADPRFPMEFSLGPDDVMMPSLRFQGRLRLTARLDADGNATTRAPGDMRGAAEGSYSPGDTGVVVLIDRVL